MGTKAALLLAERAVQMFRILPALTSQNGEAASSKSLTAARQRVKEGGLLQGGGHWRGAEGVVCSVTRRGFNPKHPQSSN